MNYLLIAAHLLLVAWGTRVVCLWTHDRRVPRPDDVRAVQLGFGVAVAAVMLAILFDATDGGRPLQGTRSAWEFAMLVCTVVSGLVILVLRNASLPRATLKGTTADGQ